MDYRKTFGRRNWKYQQDKKHKARDLKLASSRCYPTEIWVDWDWDETQTHLIPVGKYVKRSKNSNKRTYCKKQTSRKIRNSKLVPNGNAYQKFFDMWWELY